MINREALIDLIEFIRWDDYIDDAELADWLELLLPSAQAADQQYPIEEPLEARLDEYVRELRENDWRSDDDDDDDDDDDGEEDFTCPHCGVDTAYYGDCGCTDPEEDDPRPYKRATGQVKLTRPSSEWTTGWNWPFDVGSVGEVRRFDDGSVDRPYEVMFEGGGWQYLTWPPLDAMEVIKAIEVLPQ